MVDTSRGYTDLKALFPDNTTRGIHPQGIRDLIESVAHPVAGGEFDKIPSGDFIAQSTPGAPLNLTIPDGLNKGITLPLNTAANLKDPGGLLNTTQITYYNLTFAPGQAVQLSPGSWAYELLTYWDTNASGIRIGNITNVDERIEQPGQTLDSWLGDPSYAGWPTFSPEQISASSMTDKGSYRDWTTGGIIKTQATYTDSVWSFYAAQNSGAPRTLIGFYVNLSRIGAS